MPNLTDSPGKAPGAITAIRSYPSIGCAPFIHDPAPPDDDLATVVRLVRKGKLKLQVRRATPDDLHDIMELINEAKLWLPTKGTDQWSTDWADEGGRKRSDRVQHSLKEGSTWVVGAAYNRQEFLVATVTIETKANKKVWTGPDVPGNAVYLSRLVTARSFSGLKIGAALINWACDHAACEYGAKLIRIDVWTRNFALHRYYRRLGFRRRGLCPDESYPSRALFERSTSKRTWRTPRITDRCQVGRSRRQLICGRLRLGTSSRRHVPGCPS